MVQRCGNRASYQPLVRPSGNKCLDSIIALALARNTFSNSNNLDQYLSAICKYSHRRCDRYSRIPAHSQSHDSFFASYVVTLEQDLKGTAYAVLKRELSLSQFYGFDGSDTTIIDIFTVLKHSPLLGLGSKIRSPYELAYILGHICCILDFLESKKEHALLFDDDLLVKTEIAESQHGISSILDDILSYDIVYLGASQHGWEDIVDQRQYLPNQNTYGTFAICISRRAALAYLHELLSFTLPADHALKKVVQIHTDFNSAVLFPNIFIADVTHSLIRPARDMRKHALKMRWKLSDYSR